MQALQTRYVLSLRNTGLGDRLICLAAAWRYARDTGRTLVVDWRNSIYQNGMTNLFWACFERQSSIGGVVLRGSDEIDTENLPRPIFPKSWERGDALAAPWTFPVDGRPGDRERSVELIRAGKDIAEPTIVFNTCINDGIVLTSDAHDFLLALTAERSIRQKVEAFMNEAGLTRDFIGLHVRHGNGGNIMQHRSSWTSFDGAIARLERAVRHVRMKAGADLPVLLCTDSEPVQAVLSFRIGNVVTRPKWFRGWGEGDLHRGAQSALGFSDALVEMLLLAQSATLIRYPRASFFSWYAAVVKKRERPRPAAETLYDLQRPWDASDPGSPAILF